MNIFYLDKDPLKCAQYHCDRHVVKMILEYSQILSTNKRLLEPEANNDVLYKATHKNHPATQWARYSQETYLWLFELLSSLHLEYEYRYDKIHLSKRLLEHLSNVPKAFSNTGFIDPSLTMDDSYKKEDAVASYINYYKEGKKNLHQWKKRGKPYFI